MSATSDQLAPFQSSVFPVTGGVSPPKAKADVFVPIVSNASLAEFKAV